MSERGGVGTSERNNNYARSSLYFWVLILLLVLILYLKELQVFLPYGFPEKKSLCLLSPVIIVVHFILSDKILDHIGSMIKI